MRSGLRFASSAWASVLLVLVLLLLPARPAFAQEVTHTVRPGETLASIAQSYRTTVAAIVNANGLATPDLIWVGQRLIIPVRGDGSAGSTDAAGQDRVYTVRLGDTLSKIARAFGVSASAIIRANGITNPDLLYVGQRLVIPGASAGGTPAPAPTPTAQPAGDKVYIVKAGDTLGQIALRYGTTAAAIARANNLTSPDLIRVGMRLVIPGGTSAAPAPSGRASRFVVSISQQHCWLYQGNAVIGSWPCSTGRPGWPTRPGTYKVQSKLTRAYGSTWNIMMPYWLGIYWAGSTENGIHGMPWNATTGRRTWDGLVGTRITYGCVMLNDGPAKLLWDMAYIGMPVIIQP